VIPVPAPEDPIFHERQRLELLACTRLLDTEANEGFDRITRLAARLCAASGSSRASASTCAGGSCWIRQAAGAASHNWMASAKSR